MGRGAGREWLGIALAAVLTAVLAAGHARAEVPEGWRVVANGPPLRLVPQRLAPGDRFEVAVLPREPRSGRPLDVLRQRLPALLTGIGRPGRCDPVQKQAPDLASLLCSVERPDGARGIAVAMLVAGSNDDRDQPMVMVTDGQKRTLDTYSPLVMRLVAQSRRQGVALGPAGLVPPPSGPAASAGVPDEKPKLARIVMVNRPGSDGDREGAERQPYMLFADGTMRAGFDLPLDEFDVMASRFATPQRWGRWRVEDGEHVFLLPGRSEQRIRNELVHDTRPARHGQRLEGVWRSVGAGEVAFGGGANVAAYKTLAFRRDGRFAELKGADSRATPTAFRTRRTSGTYHLSGYMAELHYDDGRVVRTAFCFYPEPGETFDLGGSTFSRRK